MDPRGKRKKEKYWQILGPRQRAEKCGTCRWRWYQLYSVLEKPVQNIRKEIRTVGDRRNTREPPDYNIVKIGQNTEESSWDLRRLSVAQTPVKAICRIYKSYLLIFKWIYLTHRWDPDRYHQRGSRVELEVIAMKWSSIFHRSPELEPQYQMHFSVMIHIFRRFLLPSRRQYQLIQNPTEKACIRSSNYTYIRFIVKFLLVYWDWFCTRFDRI